MFWTALETITIILTECSLQILLFIRNLKSFLLEKQNFPTFFIQFASNIFSCLVNFRWRIKDVVFPDDSISEVSQRFLFITIILSSVVENEKVQSDGDKETEA